MARLTRLGGILPPHVGCVPHPDFAALLLFAGAEDLMVTLAGRPVGTVRVLGGTESDTRFALNNCAAWRAPLDAAIVRADIRRLTESGSIFGGGGQSHRASRRCG